MLLLLSFCTLAGTQVISIPSDDKQRLIAGNMSMTTERFMSAYMGKDLNQRRLAEMYLVGVIDSTEGDQWCNFSVVSPNAIQEQAYNGLKEALKKEPSIRASHAIISKLNKFLPCRKQK